MRQYAELIKARLENITGAIASVAKGLIYFRSDVNRIYIDDGNVDSDGGTHQVMMEKHLPEARRTTKVQLDDALTGNEVVGVLPFNKGGTGISTLTGQAGNAIVVNGTETGYEFGAAGGSAGGGTSITRNQVAHGFTVTDAIYHDGVSWQRALADDKDTLAEYIVTEVVDVDNFVAFKFGEATVTAHGYTVGQHYFLSEVIPGGAQTTEPSDYSCPLFYVEDANTLHIQVYRPSLVSEVTSNIPDALGIVVGNAADVTAADAHYSTIAEAILNSPAGGRITLLPRTFTENLTLTKELHFFGNGALSEINGTIQFSSGSERSSFEKVKFGGNITVDNGVTKLILTNGWIDNAATLTDNNPTADDSLYTLVED